MPASFPRVMHRKGHVQHPVMEVRLSIVDEGISFFHFPAVR
jgi:hypothetical protein